MRYGIICKNGAFAANAPRRRARRRSYGIQRDGVWRNWDGSYGRPSDGDNHESLQEKIELLRQKVKYVFVIFHENKSFDHHIGTYPGVNGLFRGSRGVTQ